MHTFALVVSEVTTHVYVSKINMSQPQNFMPYQFRNVHHFIQLLYVIQAIFNI